MTLIDTRHPVAWALGQAGGTLSECATVTIGDVDLTGKTVRLSGNQNRVERRAPLTDWGIEQIEERINALGAGDSTTRLLTTARASKNARTASTGALLGEVFEPGFRRAPPPGDDLQGPGQAAPTSPHRRSR